MADSINKKSTRKIVADNIKVGVASTLMIVGTALIYLMLMIAPFFMLIQLMGAGSFSDWFGSKTEDFNYYTRSYIMDEDHIAYVTTLTNKGKQKVTITVPRSIKGADVDYMGFKHDIREGGYWESKKLKRAYLPTARSEPTNDFFYKCPNLEKVLLYTYVDAPTLKKERTTNYKIYITSERYDASNNGGSNVCKSGEGKYIDVYYANVSYLFNYENDIGTYYMIDDYDYGEKILYKPKAPEREGYTFGGWYREPECISEWQFDRDTLPDAKKVDGVEQYQETKLYAKWNLIIAN